MHLLILLAVVLEEVGDLVVVLEEAVDSLLVAEVEAEAVEADASNEI